MPWWGGGDDSSSSSGSDSSDSSDSDSDTDTPAAAPKKVNAESLEFQAETKQLLDIVTNSLYTDKDVVSRLGTATTLVSF